MIGFLFKSIFGSMEPDKPVYQRFFDNFSPARNRTVIVIGGRLDPHKLQGAVDVLAGKKHARTFPKLMPQKEPGTGYIPIRFRAEDR